MASILYSIYAVAVLVVAVGGLLGVVFMTPEGSEDTDGQFKYQALTLLAVLFIVGLVGSFLL